MKSAIILLASIFILISCKRQNSETKKTITISGKLISDKSKIVYLKMIDNFNYLTNNYLIDSTTISEDGKFEFKIEQLPSNLLSLSTNNYPPVSYRVLNEMPDKYYFGGCARSFASEPTLYLTENDSVNIEWFDKEHLDSIIHKTDLAKNQNIMQKYYANIQENVAGNLDRENPLDYQTAWENVLIDQKKDLKSIDISKIDMVDSFENYIYSEITLFNLNMYLNWFEDIHPEKVNSAIINLDKSDFYSQIFAKYSDHLWNPKSFDYYKFTERYVNYHMNIKNKSFETYYKPSIEKREVAEKVLNGENKKKYLATLDEQIKNVW